MPTAANATFPFLPAVSCPTRFVVTYAIFSGIIRCTCLRVCRAAKTFRLVLKKFQEFERNHTHSCGLACFALLGMAGQDVKVVVFAFSQTMKILKTVILFLYICGAIRL